MSILVEQGINGYFSETNFFSSQSAYPITLCGFLKVSSFWSDPGFFVYTAFRVGYGTDSGHSIGIYDNVGNEVRGVQGESRTSAASSVRMNLYNPQDPGRLVNRWIPVVFVCASNGNRKVYSKLDGVLYSNSSTSTAGLSSLVNVELFVEEWTEGDIQLSYPTIYTEGLSPAEAEEWCNKAQVTGKTPYVRWDTETDWTGTDILDTSGNARHITPPGTWVYTSDGPALGPQVFTTGILTPGQALPINFMNFESPPTGARLTDPQGNPLELTIDAQASTVTAPALGDRDYCLFGPTVLELYNGSETATEDLQQFDPPAWSFVTLGETFDTGQYSWLQNYEKTPTEGAQALCETATLYNDGLWDAPEGGHTIYVIDPDDGYMDEYQIIVGDAPVDLPVGICRITRRNQTRRALTRRSLTARP